MLTQKTLTHEHKLKLRWFVALSTIPLLAVVSAFGIIPQSNYDLSFKQIVTESIALPKMASSVTKPEVFWRSERFQRGDTIDELLRRLNVDDVAASQFLRSSQKSNVISQLKTGKNVQAETLADGSLVSFKFADLNGNQVIIEKKAGQFLTHIVQNQLEKRVVVRNGEINSTLFAATDTAGISDAAAVQLADIFSGDIDFHRDLRKGDKFSVIYEMNFNNGEPVSTGNILAAEFINQGRSYRAIYYEITPHHGNYYSPEGISMRKAFLRSPLEFSRVSSGFTLSRYHPILKKWGAHKGVDYAASTGTKVKSTADGVVEFAGQQGGYGNVVIIKHQGNYLTLYGHLSKFSAGLHRGQRVTQGEVIGYVGQTGLATGPHLHYEFKINGQHRNPLSVALPDAKPITALQKAQFRMATANLDEQLNILSTAKLAQLP